MPHLLKVTQQVNSGASIWIPTVLTPDPGLLPPYTQGQIH